MSIRHSLLRKPSLEGLFYLLNHSISTKPRKDSTHSLFFNESIHIRYIFIYVNSLKSGCKKPQTLALCEIAVISKLLPPVFIQSN